MKTKEERNALKKEVETMSRKRRELTEEELEQVAGGSSAADDYSRAGNKKNPGLITNE